MILNEQIFTDNLKEIIKKGREMWQPKIKPLVSVSTENRYVSSDESARHGMWDNSLVPFAVEIMDAFCDEKVLQISMMGSAQVVKTEIIKNIIRYIIVEDPAPILLIYPTEDDARGFSTEKLEPMINNNTEINSKVSTQNARSKDNKTLYKKFLGGFLAIAGSLSPQNLARRSVKYVIADDRDRIGSAGMEGNAVDLAFQRTESYALLGRKLLEFSTPTIDKLSPIQKSYLKSDQREYYVPCPYCDHKQTLKFDNLEWKKDADIFGNTSKHYPETVKYKCENCNELIEEKHKRYMLENGEWRAKYPERLEHRGYWINRLYTPFSTWEMLVKEFLKTKDDPEKFRVFLNTSLAQTFKLEKGEELDEMGLLERVENYIDEKGRIPNEILLITAAIDQQDDRLEIQFIGWGANEEAWVLDYKKLYGDTALQDVYDDLDDYIAKKFKFIRKDGIVITTRLIFFDSGGHNTQMVYEYTKARKRIIAIKGQDGSGKPILLNVSSVGRRRDVALQNVGVDSVKSLLYKRLSDSKQKDKIHFEESICDLSYFHQLTAEKAVSTYDKKNRTAIVWKKKSSGIRNEVLDLWVYAYAAMVRLNPNWESIKKNIDAKKQKLNETDDIIEQQPDQPKQKTKVRKRKRNNFINKWR